MPDRPGEPDNPYVSRGGLKLRHALEHFGLDPEGMRCADLGCSTGGFTDCLLRSGAAHVFSVDTAYGEFAWTLRNDPRVTLLERTNALHVTVPEAVGEGVDLVVIDLGWTRQELAIPAALRWLSESGRIVTLVKPHYESPRASGVVGPVTRRGRRQKPKIEPLTDEASAAVAERVVGSFPSLGVEVVGMVASPIRGRKSDRGAAPGNQEHLALLRRAR